MPKLKRTSTPQAKSQATKRKKESVTPVTPVTLPQARLRKNLQPNREELTLPEILEERFVKNEATNIPDYNPKKPRKSIFTESRTTKDPLHEEYLSFFSANSNKSKSFSYSSTVKRILAMMGILDTDLILKIRKIEKKQMENFRNGEDMSLTLDTSLNEIHYSIEKKDDKEFADAWKNIEDLFQSCKDLLDNDLYLESFIQFRELLIKLFNLATQDIEHRNSYKEALLIINRFIVYLANSIIAEDRKPYNSSYPVSTLLYDDFRIYNKIGTKPCNQPTQEEYDYAKQQDIVVAAPQSQELLNGAFALNNLISATVLTNKIDKDSLFKFIDNVIESKLATTKKPAAGTRKT